ncbi:DUF1203 domain-containing protein, partial [Lysobacter sp. D1-1-M9]|uniref:DUF1203 domain-containing protein n=1 Tax=Novilysobacter longmucuonensis TaxID=3098603 RepID=UPI002FCA7DAA
MSFRITGLQAEPFRHLFWLPEEALAAHGAQRWMATGDAALPDRVELRDAEAGETLLLVNYEHQPAATPYRSTHAIFVLEGARQPYDRIDAVPKALSSRMLSLRAFDH